MHERLEKYVSRVRASGHSDDDIRSQLQEAGYADEEIEEAISGNEAAQEGSEPRSRTGGIIVLVALLIVSLGVTAYLFWPAAMPPHPGNVGATEAFTFCDSGSCAIGDVCVQTDAFDASREVCVPRDDVEGSPECLVGDSHAEQCPQPCEGCADGHGRCMNGGRAGEQGYTLQNQCVDCTDSSHCRDGFVCAGYHCVESTCAVDADCPSGSRCIQGICGS